MHSVERQGRVTAHREPVGDCRLGPVLDRLSEDAVDLGLPAYDRIADVHQHDVRHSLERGAQSLCVRSPNRPVIADLDDHIGRQRAGLPIRFQAVNDGVGLTCDLHASAEALLELRLGREHH